jgi:hypothetical protein
MPDFSKVSSGPPEDLTEFAERLEPLVEEGAQHQRGTGREDAAVRALHALDDSEGSVRDDDSGRIFPDGILRRGAARSTSIRSRRCTHTAVRVLANVLVQFLRGHVRPSCRAWTPSLTT